MESKMGKPQRKARIMRTHKTEIELLKKHDAIFYGDDITNIINIERLVTYNDHEINNRYEIFKLKLERSNNSTIDIELMRGTTAIRISQW